MRALRKNTPLMAVITAMLCMSVRAGIVTNLDLQPHWFKATEGSANNHVTVAVFPDPGEMGTALTTESSATRATNYTGTINWGDGTDTDPATIEANPKDGFSVKGTHTYVEEGTYNAIVEVTDIYQRHGSTTNVVTVCDAKLKANGVNVTAIEGLEFAGLVATFTDENPYAKRDEFTANIDWGDGTAVTPGIVATNEFGKFMVFGSHTYWEEKSFTIKVDIADVGGSKTSAASTAKVSDAPLIATAWNIAPVEGTSFTGLVATFTDGNTNAQADEFTALVDWGDGTPLYQAAVEGIGSGGFQVIGTHIYRDEGSLAVVVNIVDSGGSFAQVAGTATIGDAPLKGAGSPISPVEGAPFTAVVASFTDGNIYATEADFTAMISWDEGQPAEPGVVTANGSGGFDVKGTHTYIEDGSHAITVVVNDVGGASGAFGNTANVVDAALSASSTIIAVTEGAPFTNVVATFTDANIYATEGDFTATIAWESGQIAEQGVVTANESGGFNVSGSHTYATRGSYGITVNIYDVGGSSTSVGSTANVADAPVTSIGRLITPTENASFTAVVANFTDANPYGTTNEFIADLAWGDGTNSRGTIIANTEVNTGSAEFIVLGSHEYAGQGLYPLSVTITSVGGTAKTVAQSAANTADAPMIGTGKAIAVVKGVAFTNVLANCADTDTTPEPESTYNCYIDWGDGMTSPGTMGEVDEGSYAVTGSHTYAKSGSYVVLVTIDNTQTFVSTTARSTALVSEQPADNLTSQFVVKATRPRLNKRTGLFQQVVTIRNAGRLPVRGPVSIVLDNLSNGGGGIALYNMDGKTLTAGAAPLGSPYKFVVLPKNNVFNGRATRSVTLYFSSSAPTITYNARVLAGSGAR